MVLISHRKSFIYIKTAKTASTSVEAYFEKYCLDPNEKYEQIHLRQINISEFGIIGYRGAGKSDNRFFNHMSASEIKDRIGDDKFNKYFKFCVIRNPYDKMVSKYFMFRKMNDNKYESFKDFCIRTDCFNLEIYSINNKPVCDYYIRYENLYEDIKKVCNILNIEFNLKDLPSYYSSKEKYYSYIEHKYISLRQKECKNPKDYRKYYDEEIKKIVYEKHKKEFELWNYDF